MAQRLFKAKKQKIVPKKAANGRVASANLPKKNVLVGTYAGDQLKEWPGKVVGACDYAASCGRDVPDASGMDGLPFSDAARTSRPRAWDEGYPYWWELSNVDHMIVVGDDNVCLLEGDASA